MLKWAMRPSSQTPINPGYSLVLRAPFGALGIRCNGAKIVAIDILNGSVPEQTSNDAFLSSVVCDFNTYFDNPAHVFTSVFAVGGTAFQRRVWQHLCAIAPGRPQTYGEVARKLGSAPRAVGQACAANAIPLLIPCHRVVAAHGHGGFMHARAGQWIDVKRWLLSHEARCATAESASDRRAA